MKNEELLLRSGAMMHPNQQSPIPAPCDTMRASKKTSLEARDAYARLVQTRTTPSNKRDSIAALVLCSQMEEIFVLVRLHSGGVAEFTMPLTPRQTPAQPAGRRRERATHTRAGAAPCAGASSPSSSAGSPPGHTSGRTCKRCPRGRRRGRQSRTACRARGGAGRSRPTGRQACPARGGSPPRRSSPAASARHLRPESSTPPAAAVLPGRRSRSRCRRSRRWRTAPWQTPATGSSSMAPARPPRRRPPTARRPRGSRA
mmetsp:Transcript_82256/g.214665  ORF Transcript_82256/g.214665 Transcript_82256/m.214665 type:complete len:258 (+) Transcript_82256:225-998(+)